MRNTIKRFFEVNVHSINAPLCLKRIENVRKKEKELLWSGVIWPKPKLRWRYKLENII